jgi:hypothetical protein
VDHQGLRQKGEENTELMGPQAGPSGMSKIQGHLGRPVHLTPLDTLYSVWFPDREHPLSLFTTIF